MIPSSQPPAPSAQYAAAPGAAPGGYTGMPGTPTQQQTPQQVSFIKMLSINTMLGETIITFMHCVA